MKNEKNIKAFNGYIFILVLLILITTTIVGGFSTKNPIFLALVPFIIFILPGFFIVQPNGGFMWRQRSYACCEHRNVI